MKKFIKHFFLYVFCFLIIIFIKNFKSDYLRISNSDSFNAKYKNLVFYKKNISVLSMGSSMTLNNLSTEILCKNFVDYYNFSSWGMPIEETCRLSMLFSKFYKLTKVIMVIQFDDFYASTKDIRIPSNFMIKSLRYKYQYNFLKYFFPVDNNSQLNKWSEINDDYYSLNFDSCGGVNLNIPNENISQKRWETRIDTTHKYNIQLEEFNDFLKQMKTNNIEVYIAIPPTNGYYLQSSKDSTYYLDFISKCRILVEKNNFIFYNECSIFEPSDFVDSTHLSSKGAKKFSIHFMNYINNF